MSASAEPVKMKKIYDLLKVNVIMDIKIGDRFKVFDPSIAPAWNLVRGEALTVKKTSDGVRYFETNYGEHFPYCEHIFKSLGLMPRGNTLS
ncbi:hypothetical protein D3C87_280160 [compost metagenome]